MRDLPCQALLIAVPLCPSPSVARSQRSSSKLAPGHGRQAASGCRGAGPRSGSRPATPLTRNACRLVQAFSDPGPSFSLEHVTEQSTRAFETQRCLGWPGLQALRSAGVSPTTVRSCAVPVQLSRRRQGRRNPDAHLKPGILARLGWGTASAIQDQRGRPARHHAHAPADNRSRRAGRRPCIWRCDRRTAL